MWQRLTDEARKAIFHAQEAAQKFGHSDVRPEHILAGLLKQDGSTACKVLVHCGHGPKNLLAALEHRFVPQDNRSLVDVTLTPDAKRAIDLAYSEARRFNSNFIGSEHLLLGCCLIENGPTWDIFRGHLIEIGTLRQAFYDLGLAEGNPAIDPPQSATRTRYRPTYEDLICMLTGGGLEQHLAISLLADGGSHVSAPARELIGDPEPLVQSFVDQIQELSEQGVGRARSASLSSLLRGARSRADGAPVTSGHFLLAMLEGNEELARAFADAGLTSDLLRERLGS